MSAKNLLESVYLFKGLETEDIDRVSEIAELETFSPGDEIFNQGDAARALYFIKYGTVKITQHSSNEDNDISVATLGTGSHFGEMAFLDGENRSASAVAVEKSEIAVLDYDKLSSLLREQMPIAVHFYRELAHFLCGRLRVTTNDLSFAREKNLSHF